VRSERREVGAKPGVLAASVDRGNVVEGGGAHARLVLPLDAGLVVPARNTMSCLCPGSKAPAPSGVRLQGCGYAHTWATGPMVVRRRWWGASATKVRGHQHGLARVRHLSRASVITLSGVAEIGLHDGTHHHLGPGDPNMAEALTEHGHTTRVVGQVPRVTATIHIEATQRALSQIFI
jgi:hypothetical protein